MTRALAFILVLVITLGARAETVIELKPVARIEPGKPALLADIATITGDDAETVGELVVIQDPASSFQGRRWGSVDVPAVRDLLKRERPKRFHLVRGKLCSIGIRASTDSIQLSEPAGPAEPGTTAGATVRDHVIARLESLLDADRDDLRITFAEGDQPFLARPTIGMRVSVQPTGVSSRIPMRVTIYDPTGRMTDGTVRPDVQVQRQGPVVLRSIRRGEMIHAEDIAIESRWVSPDIEVASSDQAIGAEASAPIGKGDMVTSREVRPPLLVEDGDLVKVHCVIGGVVVETEARALDDGRLGETIRFEPKRGPGARDGQAFEAKVVGRARAVIIEENTFSTGTPSA